MEEQLLNSLAPAEVLARAAKPRWPLEQLQFLQMLAAKDPSILAQFGASPQVQQQEAFTMGMFYPLMVLSASAAVHAQDGTNPTACMCGCSGEPHIAGVAM